MLILGELSNVERDYVLPWESIALQEDIATFSSDLMNWRSYYELRGFNVNSPICILLQWPLTLYYILMHCVAQDCKFILDLLTSYIFRAEDFYSAFVRYLLSGALSPTRALKYTTMKGVCALDLQNGACSQFHHLLKTVLCRLTWVGSASE